MSNIHALIQSFLQQQTVIPLGTGEGAGITKAGVVPFMRAPDGFRFYVMQPKTSHPELPPQLLQI